VDRFGNEFSLSIAGRHDPCICPRVVPVAEAMAALVILDLLFTQEALSSEKNSQEMLAKEIQAADAQLLLLLQRRLQLSATRVAFHEETGTEDTLKVEALREPARELGLNEDMVERIWKEIGAVIQPEVEETGNGN